MTGQFRPRGVTMRDCSTNRAGFDRVLMAVAATFLAVSATAALAQSDGPRTSAAELAIDAAVPRPEPANVPPPTASDFKIDTTASTPDAARTAAPSTTATAPEPKPAKEPVKAASNVPAADQPVADKLREMLGGKPLRYFDRRAERAAVERFYSAREYAPQWTQAGKLTDSGKGIFARLKDAADDG